MDYYIFVENSERCWIIGSTQIHTFFIYVRSETEIPTGKCAFPGSLSLIPLLCREREMIKSILHKDILKGEASPFTFDSLFSFSQHIHNLKKQLHVAFHASEVMPSSSYCFHASEMAPSWSLLVIQIYHWQEFSFWKQHLDVSHTSNFSGAGPTWMKCLCCMCEFTWDALSCCSEMWFVKANLWFFQWYLLSSDLMTISWSQVSPFILLCLPLVY